MTIKDELTATFEGKLGWHQERSILETTELICQLMQEQGISRVELARRLNKSKGYISQLLDGTANMTIRTMSDMFVALDREFHPSVSVLEAPSRHTVDLGVVPLEWSCTATMAATVFSGDSTPTVGTI